MGVQAQAQVEKKCYKNQTNGHLGVVKLDHLGAQVGFNVPPLGTVWLSDDEAKLTARAPVDPAHNPFAEQVFKFLDEHGQPVEAPMRPLVLIEDDREIPDDDRFVPTIAAVTPEAQAANAAATAAVLEREDDRDIPSQPVEPVVLPESGAAVPPRVAAPEGSWTEPEGQRTLEPQPGALSGGPAQEDGEGEPTPVAPVGGPVPAQAVPTSVASQPQNQGAVPSESAGTGDQAGSPSEQATQERVGIEAKPDGQPHTAILTDGKGGSQAVTSSVTVTPPAEEHAGVTPNGEETGAAQTPAGEAPEGEFASHEEVGSPEAPKQGEPS